MTRSHALLLLALAAATLGCGDGGGPTSAVPLPVLSLEIAGGNNQAGPVDTSLREFLLVRVIDEAGQPVPDVRVVWAVVEGDAELSVKRPATDAAGLASATLFLGETLGEKVVRARIVDGAEVLFRAQATNPDDDPR